jgi:hypothetical protein
MALQYLQFRPGVSRESTNLANTGGFYACQWVRFRSGSPEKINGWVLPSTNTYAGTCRSLVEWVALNGNYIVGLGTNLKYYLYIGGVYFDITPIRLSSNLAANPFYPIYSTLSAGISATDTTISVTSGTSFTRVYPYTITIDSEDIYVTSAAVNTLSTCIRGYNGTTAAVHSTSAVVSSPYLVVASTANAAYVGDYVTFTAATAFGPYSITVLNAEYTVASQSTNYICIYTGIQSTAVTNGGGSAPVVAKYQIHVGQAVATFGNGWGVGPWGDSLGWGVPYPSTYELQGLRLWSADNFGQDLVYNVRDGGVYYWSAATYLTLSGQVTGRGVDISTGAFGADTAPNIAARVFVTEERHIVVLGANDPYATAPTATTDQDPMLVRWCSQGNPLVWTPAVTNTAGSQRLVYGSTLITSEKTRQETLIWSDSALYSMRYLGPPYTFGFSTLSNEVSIASPNSAITANGITYWMGNDKFYAYSGRVDTLPCALRQYIFDDFNLSQSDQVCAGTNEKYNEIWWFYPSSTSDYNDRYAVYNYLEKLWYYGDIARMAWLDSHILGSPWATYDNILVQHEQGTNDGSINPPAGIPAYIESADFDIGEGDKFSAVNRVVPDVDFIGSVTSTPSVTMTISTRNFPGQGFFINDDVANVSGTKATTQVYDYTNQVYLRLRGRQVAFRISSSAAGVKWQLGVPRLDVQPDGTRS